MTENYTFDELKKMKRNDLAHTVETLTKENQDLRKQAEALSGQIVLLQDSAKEQQVKWEQAGSLADYSAEISRIMEAAQKTADVYLENIQNAKIDKEREAQDIIDKAKKNADEMVTKAKRESEQIKSSSASVLEDLKVNVDKYLESIQEKIDDEKGAVEKGVSNNEQDG